MTDMEIPQAAIETAAQIVYFVRRGVHWDFVWADEAKRAEAQQEAREVASELLAAVLPHLLTEVVVHHYDIEKHAASFNEGYDEANRQRIGGEASRNWLTEKVWPLLKDHIEPENSHHVADQIADALLSEADLDPSEVKSMCETATALGLALGREEVMAELRAEWPNVANEMGIARKTCGCIIGPDHTRADHANLSSRSLQVTSNGLTASSRHPGAPEDTKPPQEGSGTVDLVAALRGAVDAARKRRLAEQERSCDCYKLPRSAARHLTHHPQCPNKPAPDLPEESDQ